MARQMAKRETSDDDSLLPPPLANTIFAGQQAADHLAVQGITGPANALALARKMKAGGATSKQIHAHTSKMLESTPYAGVSFDTTGEPLFEIDDSTAKVRAAAIPKGGKNYLGNVLDHPELYRAVPGANMPTVTKASGQNSSYTPGSQEIEIGKQHFGTVLGRQVMSPSGKSRLLHETQHVVQELHGLDAGASPADFPGVPPAMQNELYKHVGGENYAVATMEREKRTAAERRARHPELDMRVKIAKQIPSPNSGGVNLETEKRNAKGPGPEPEALSPQGRGNGGSPVLAETPNRSAHDVALQVADRLGLSRDSVSLSTNRLGGKSAYLRTKLGDIRVSDHTIGAYRMSVEPRGYDHTIGADAIVSDIKNRFAKAESKAVERQISQTVEREAKRVVTAPQRAAEAETRAAKDRFYAERGLTDATETAKKKAWKEHLRSGVTNDTGPKQQFIEPLIEAATEAWKRAMSKDIVEGKPIKQRRIDPRKVAADPEAFQFKSGGDAAGVTDRLKGVTQWDPLAAGKQIVFERANGEYVIADGHQRRGLALRAIEKGQKGVMLDAFVLREKDGWKPSDVRAYAALKNMKESSGNALDMAKVMRERPDLVGKSLPMSDGKIREAMALAKLSPRAFDMVASGAVKPEHAAAVGAQVGDSARHVDMLTEMAKAGMRSADHARLYVSQAMAAPSISETQSSLFGDETKVRSLLAERAKVLDRALSTLKSDKRIFAMLEREAGNIEAAGNKLAHTSNLERADSAGRLAELVEKLSTTRGPVSEMLDRAALAMAEGKAPAQAARGFVTDVSKAMKAGGINGLMGDSAAPAMAPAVDPNQGSMFGERPGWSDEARAASAEVRKGKKQMMVEEEGMWSKAARATGREPDHNDRRLDQEMAARRNRAATIESSIRDAMDSGKPLRIEGSKGRVSAMVSRAPDHNGIRITRFVDGEPSGHTDLKGSATDIREAASEMAGYRPKNRKQMMVEGSDGHQYALSKNKFGNESGQFEYTIYRDGKIIGSAIGRVDGKTARIDYIGTHAGGAHNRDLGVAGIKALREEMRRDFPKVNAFEGMRISGARAKANPKPDGSPRTKSERKAVDSRFDKLKQRVQMMIEDGKPKGQTSFLPDVTDADRIKAAMNKPLRGGNAPMDDGLFGSSMQQTDLVEMAKAKQSLPAPKQIDTHNAALTQTENTGVTYSAAQAERDRVAAGTKRVGDTAKDRYTGDMRNHPNPRMATATSTVSIKPVVGPNGTTGEYQIVEDHYVGRGNYGQRKVGSTVYSERYASHDAAFKVLDSASSGTPAPNNYGGVNRPLPAADHEIALLENAIKNGKSVELSTTHKDIISRATNEQVSRLDTLAHEYRKANAATDNDFNRVSAFREAFRAQAKATSDAVFNAANPGWSDAARESSAKVRAENAMAKPTKAGGDRQRHQKAWFDTMRQFDDAAAEIAAEKAPKKVKAGAQKAPAAVSAPFDPYASSLIPTAQREGAAGLAKALSNLSGEEAIAALKAQTGTKITPGATDAETRAAVAKAIGSTMANRAAAAGGETLAEKHRAMGEESANHLRGTQNEANREAIMANRKGKAKTNRPAGIISSSKYGSGHAPGRLTELEKDALVRKGQPVPDFAKAAAEKANAELAARKEKVRSGTKVSGEETLKALAGPKPTKAAATPKLPSANALAKMRDNNWGKSKHDPRSPFAGKSPEVLDALEKQALANIEKARAKQARGEAGMARSGKSGSINSYFKASELQKVGSWHEQMNKDVLEHISKVKAASSPATPGKKQMFIEPTAPKPSLASRAGHAFNVAGIAGIGAGVGAAAVLAANEAAENGATMGQQVAAGAKAGAIAAAPAAVVGGGLAAAAKFGGKTVAKAVPVVGWGLAAGAAAYGAISEGMAAAKAGKGAGGIAKAAGWGAINSVVPIDHATQAARSVWDRATAPRLTQPGMMAAYAEANERYRSQQMNTTQTDHSDRKPGWGPEARIAAAKARGVAALPYGGDPSQAPGYIEPKKSKVN